MSDFQYKNPLTPEQLNGAQSVTRTETFGTNFSVLGIGGFMEVYNITDLYFTIPPATTGPIELSGNTIPISFLKGSGTPFSPDVLTLNSDNISSGRRRLGMLIYVYETDQVYQYQIDNFLSLWSAATGSTGVGGDTVIFSDFGTTVKNNSVAGQNFINAWTANTIDGVSGNVRSNSVWKKYYGTNLAITGGTYNSFTGTLTLVNITGGTVPITGISGGGGGGGITGGTFIYSAQTLELYSSGGTLSITGFSDVYVTGGTYSAGTITFINNSGGTFTVTGIPTGGGGVSGDYLPLSGGTVTGGTIFTAGVTANTLSSVDYIDFDLLSGATAPSSVSRLRYVADEGGLVTTLIGGNIDLQIGQQNVVYCFNGDTVNLTKGQVVAITGNQGNRPRIQRAIASAETTSSTSLGVVSETINTGSEGFVTTFGNVRGFQITGITPGSYVYLSPTVLGGFTGTQPQAPQHIVAIGYVVRTGNTQGEIFVNINNGWELNELHNVRITNPSQYDILQYSAGTSPVWYNTGSPFFSGLTATTISATTYQNLPVSAVTGTTGISASTSNGVVTISNTQTQGITGITATDGVSANTTSFGTIIINTDKGSSQNIFKNIFIGGVSQFAAASNNSNLNFSGINISVFSAASNTIVFSAATGSTGTGGGTTVTGGTYSAGTLTLGNSTGGTVSITGFPTTTSFGVSVDGSGGVITTGQKGYIRIPYNYTITAWSIIGTPSGSITFDIWKANNTIPTVANTIIGGGGVKPALVSTTFSSTTTLTNWTVTGLTNDIIGWNVDSCTTTTQAILQLYVTRTS